MSELVLAADIGRSTCRIALAERDATAPVMARASVPNGVGLADADAARRVADAIEAALHTVSPSSATSASITAATSTAAPTSSVSASPLTVPTSGFAVVTVGVAGAAQAPSAADELRRELQRRLTVDDVRVVSDVVTAHRGALAGEPGVCLIAGTGAVALAIDATGRYTLVDGHGWLLGDDGGGVSIGRAGVAAAMRALDGRPGGSTALADRVAARLGPLDQLAQRLHADPHLARTLATVVPDVADAARAGDAVAAAILARAVEELHTTLATAIDHLDVADDPQIALRGGLFELHDLVSVPLRAAIATSHPTVRIVDGADALEGALLLARGSWHADTSVLQSSARWTDPTLQPVPVTTHDEERR